MNPKYREQIAEQYGLDREWVDVVMAMEPSQAWIKKLTELQFMSDTNRLLTIYAPSIDHGNVSQKVTKIPDELANSIFGIELDS